MILNAYISSHFDVVVAKLQYACVREHPSSDLHNLHQRGYDVKVFGIYYISVTFNKEVFPFEEEWLHRVVWFTLVLEAKC